MIFYRVVKCDPLNEEKCGNCPAVIINQYGDRRAFCGITGLILPLKQNDDGSYYYRRQDECVGAQERAIENGGAVKVSE